MQLLWQRGRLAMFRAEREGRLLHRHNWRRIESALWGFKFTCEICPKVVTDQQLAAARDNPYELLAPMRQEQVQAWYDDDRQLAIDRLPRLTLRDRLVFR
jgi:hypothetical protein